MSKLIVPKWMIAVAAVAGLGLITLAPYSSFANGSDSGGGGGGSKCGKYEKGSKAWKKCMSQLREDTEDAYALGYWLAKTGEYAEAVKVLGSANQSDPRVLTMLGYATRHLGDVDKALPYYYQALAANPNLTSTRQYLGEAFLQQKQAQKAKEQLAEIGKRCGATCEDYQTLSNQIVKFEQSSKG